MTEAEWLTCASCSPMLAFVTHRSSQRKLRLFAVACCHRVRRLLPEPEGTKSVDVAERLADGLATNAERRAAAVTTGRGPASYTVAVNAYEAAVAVARQTATALADTYRKDGDAVGPEWDLRRNDELSAQAALLRCIFGNPFRPVTLDPSWRTSTVVALTEGIYADRAFDRLPILADALQDAGCDNEDVLAHCRAGGPHARGCWVVDLLLGKE